MPNDIRSESTHQTHSQKSCILLGRVSTKDSNFEFLAFFFLSFLWPFNMVVTGEGGYKMCDIFKTAGHRAKRTKRWAQEELLSVYRVPLFH